MSVASEGPRWRRPLRSLYLQRSSLRSGGRIISLVKPHYEAEPSLLRDGVLAAEQVELQSQLKNIIDQADPETLRKFRELLGGHKEE